MAKLIMFSIYDHKTETFSPPFFARHVGEATRMFAEVAQDPKSNVGKYPGDFRLYRLADFDDQNGAVMPLQVKADLGLASDMTPKS